MPRQLTLIIVGGSKTAEKARELLDAAKLDYDEVDIRHNGAAPYLTRDFGPGATTPLLVIDGNPISGLDEIERFSKNYL